MARAGGEQKEIQRRLNAIPNEYIVVLDETIDEKELDPTIDQLAAEHSAVVLTRYAYAFKGFLAQMSEDAALEMNKSPLVTFIQEDHEFGIDPGETESPLIEEPSGESSWFEEDAVSALQCQQNPPWTLNRIDQRNLPLDTCFRYSNNASLAHIYIVDSGIRPTHNEFRNAGNTATRVMLYSTNGSFKGSRNFAKSTYPDNHLINPARIDDCYGHGTFVASQAAGKILGVAKNAILHSVRIADCGGNTRASTVADGLNWIANPANLAKPAVVNLSYNFDPANYHPVSEIDAMETAIRTLVNTRKVTVVVSAGNWAIPRPNQPHLPNASDNSPARLTVPGVVVVGASGENDARATISCYGPSVDVYAPGVNSTGASHTSDTARVTNTGTSFAAPLVAGYAGILLHTNSTKTAAEIEQQIIANATSNKVTNVPLGTKRLLYTLP